MHIGAVMNQPLEEFPKLQPEFLPGQLEIPYPDYTISHLEQPENWPLIAAAKYAASRERALRQELETDELTGLPNMRGFKRIVAELPEDTEHILLFVDVDAFKEVNDQLSHQSADIALREVIAPFLRELKFRGNTGKFARRSGDEFIGLFPFHPDDSDRRQPPRGVIAAERRRREDLDGLQLRLRSEWDKYVSNITDPSIRSILDSIYERGIDFGLSMGPVKLRSNATLNDAVNAIDQADALMNMQKVHNEARLLDQEQAAQIINIYTRLKILGISPRRLKRAVQAAYAVMGINFN
jgi:GGDEF domain-containing protein